MNTDIQPVWVPCPQCGRRWAHASEQAVVVEAYGKCAGCILVDLQAPARAREQAAGYRAIQCPNCAMTGDPQCPVCEGQRVALMTLDGSEFIDIRQPEG